MLASIKMEKNKCCNEMRMLGRLDRMTVFFCLFLFLFGLVGATKFSGSTNSVQYYSPSMSDIYSSSEISTQWGGLSFDENDDCEAMSDFVIGIVPDGCRPMVVTSDLLEEQDVPVYCQLYAIQINPLVDVAEIESISFSGDYPEGVSGISFYPAQAAINSQVDLKGTATTTNIGYVVIVLKQNKVEDNMSDYVSGNLTARIKYNAESVYGMGKAKYYLSEGDEVRDNSFWNGMGFLRLVSTDGDSARVEVYNGDDVYRTVSLEKGKDSDVVYFPGYYCRAGFKMSLVGVVAAEDSALLNVDGNDVWVHKGSKFLHGNCRVSSLNVRNGGGSVKVSCSGSSFTLKLVQTGAGLADEYVGDDVLRAFREANDTVNELVENYRAEENEFGMRYGEEALFRQINLAGEIMQYSSQLALAKLFVEKYPTSRMLPTVEDVIFNIQIYDASESLENVYVGNDYHVIRVEKFRDVDGDAKRVDFVYDGVTYKDMKVGNRTKSGGDYVLVEEIFFGQARFSVYVDGKRKEHDVIKEGEYGALAGKDIKVTSVEVLESAEIVLKPVVDNKNSEANFSFGVGIEKRAIDLSPEKTRSMIKNLDESIGEWTDINNRLGDLVTGMKGACYATAAVLTVKNFVSGVSGEATARKAVMAKVKEKCSTEYWEMSSTECYNKLSDEIKVSVDKLAIALDGVNEKMDGVLESYSKSGVITDNKAYLEALRGKVRSGWRYENLDVGDLTNSGQIASVLLVEQLTAAGVGGTALDAAMSSMEKELKSAVILRDSESALDAATRSFRKLLKQDLPVQSSVGAGAVEYVWSNSRANAELAAIVNGVEENDMIQAIDYGGVNYLFKLRGSASGRLSIEKVYIESAGGFVEKVYSGVGTDISPFRGWYFVVREGESCSNVWIGGASVSYYEVGSAKGKPAFVPFDLKRGWYTKVASDAYADSGDFSTLRICNIGPDGKSGTGDDPCQSFNSNTAAKVETFSECLITKEEVAEIYEKARAAVREASRQYRSSSVTINGQKMNIAEPTSTSTQYECQDFMSPEDCMLLFNLCDPVICPASRCDMGGRMSVSNVVQSGIIGSILLCLPNIEEGIYVPVCLTGVHAGIDSWVSILKSERDCLQTSLETGENVGICDAVTSVYICEFFWNQFSSFIDKGFDVLFSNLLGGGQTVSGGGEYLLIADAWESTQSAVSYFKNSYAANAFAAFRLKNVASAGTQVCEAYVGATVPTSAELVDSLLAPESPTQFYAYFSSSVFSGATVPVTAQYKVYYHIYAGKDAGAQYKVYLKDPPLTSYYTSHQRIEVDGGYVAVGESVDETKDFTAPEGYKQLCVMINGKEECGFGTISTSLVVNYTTAKYVESVVEETGIDTEHKCISGQGSVWSLAKGLNIQSSVEDIIDSDVSLDGIVRVCATDDPGNSVGEPSRWSKVGTCGDSMDCYLDVSSVQGALSTVAAIENKSVVEMMDSMGLIMNGTGRMSYKDVGLLLGALDAKIEALTDAELMAYKTEIKVINILANLTNIGGIGAAVGQGTNADRARAYLLKSMIYHDVVRSFLRAAAARVSKCEASCEASGYLDSAAGMTVNDCSRRNGRYTAGCCCWGLPGPADPTSVPISASVSSSACQKEVGREIIRIAREIKGTNSGIDDSVIEAETGYKSFECLALGLASQESSLTHCDRSKTSECLDCGGSGYDNVLKVVGDGHGVMQINVDVHSGSFDLFGNNVEYGLKKVLYANYLASKSSSRYPRKYDCNGEVYGGWEAALRRYNGWNLDCSVGDLDYVESVLDRRGWVEANFGECGSGGSVGGGGLVGGGLGVGGGSGVGVPVASKKCIYDMIVLYDKAGSGMGLSVDVGSSVVGGRVKFASVDSVTVQGADCGGRDAKVVILDSRNNEVFSKVVSFNSVGVFSVNLKGVSFVSGGEYAVMVSSADGERFYVKGTGGSDDSDVWIGDFEVV